MCAAAFSRPGQRALRRLSQLALGTVALAVVLWLGVAVAAHSARDPAGTPVYTVAALRAHLQHEPAVWRQRTVRVHAVAMRCQAWLAGPGSPCLDQQPALIDSGDAAMAVLPLTTELAPSALAWLRGLPIVGRFAPPPRAPVGHTNRLCTTDPRDTLRHRQPAALPPGDAPGCRAMRRHQALPQPGVVGRWVAQMVAAAPPEIAYQVAATQPLGRRTGPVPHTSMQHVHY
jgi:hypothetical protein